MSKTNEFSTLTPITSKQFGWSSVFITLFGILSLLPGKFWIHLASSCLVMSMFVAMTRAERTRPQPTRQVLAVFGVLAFFIAVGIILQRNHLIPDEWEKPVMRVLHHPALIVPVWGVMMLVTYQRWRLDKKSTAT